MKYKSNIYSFIIIKHTYICVYMCVLYSLLDKLKEIKVERKSHLLYILIKLVDLNFAL